MTHPHSDDFVTGDVVRLKSGSPAMTVEQVERGLGLDIVHTIWMDTQTVYRSKFNARTLIPGKGI